MSENEPKRPDIFKAWARLGDIPVRPSQVSREILLEIQPRIDTGQIRIEWENEKYFELIASKYPIGFNRIDWRGVRECLFVASRSDLQNELSGEEHVEKLVAFRPVLVSWFSKNNIGPEDSIVWIGDGCDLSLHMSIRVLSECYPLLFSWPQHHYILPVHAEWCLNYTMEGRCYFGKQENALVRGCVDLDAPEKT